MGGFVIMMTTKSLGGFVVIVYHKNMYLANGCYWGEP